MPLFTRRTARKPPLTLLAIALVSTATFITTAVRASQTSSQEPAPTAAELAALQEEGETVYSTNCAQCHGAEGTDGIGTRLAASASLGNKTYVVRRIIEGMLAKGMPQFATLTDRKIAAVSTFIRTAWDNVDGPIVEAEVKKIRTESSARSGGL